MKNDIKELDGLEIFLGYKCSVKCYFCYQKDLRFNYTDNLKKEEVIDILTNGFNNGKRFIIFSGGEPTLDSNLPFYISFSKKLGYEHIRVHTNGYGFKNNDYLIDLYKRGLTGVTISIHGYNDSHDKVTGVKGSFDVIKKAIKNFELIKKLNNDFVIDTNTVITNKNYKDIPKLIKFLCNFSITRGQIVLAYSLSLFTKEEKLAIIPEYNNIVTIIKKCLKIAYIYKRKFVLENIPFCVIEDKYWESIITNIKIKKESITIKEGNIGITNLKWMSNSSKCNICIMNDICRGIPKDYYEIYGDNCLKTLYD